MFFFTAFITFTMFTSCYYNTPSTGFEKAFKGRDTTLKSVESGLLGKAWRRIESASVQYISC
jgi:hypothetical protein